jgi:adenine/guanine phosphoribosyltransferase-like PRPP-binding protein
MEKIRILADGTVIENGPDVIPDTIARVEKLLDQPVLRERIKSGAYGLVVGVDASGRVPALLMHKIVLGFRNVPLRFVAGKKTFDEIDVQDRANGIGSVIYGMHDTLQDQGGGRVLLVDDVISSGEAIADICREMQVLGMTYDIAVLGAQGTDDESNTDIQAKKLGGEVFYAQIDHPDSLSFPEIYGRSEYSGVVKSGGAIYAQPAILQNRDELDTTREEIADAANAFIAKLENQ